jgi:hypothetical protein
MTKTALEAALARLDIWLQIFGAMVAIGIVGEVGIGLRHWILNRQLQTIQHIEDQAHEQNIAEANERSAKAQEEAAKANLELERIKAPRTISSQDQTEIIAALKPFSGTPYDLVVGTDSESLNFMKTIQSLLTQAGWVQVPAKGAVGLTNSNPLIGITVTAGVYIEIDAGKLGVWLPAIDKFKVAFEAKNIPVHGSAAQTGVDPTAVHVGVGKKP